MRRQASVLYALAVLATGGLAVAAATAATHDAQATPCKRGSKSAVIGGKRVCLKAGQTCNRKLDKQYHRYRFHCHTGRLVRFKPASPPPPPPPPPPPALPGQRIDVGGYRLYIECTGTGSPTTVFEAGSGSAGATKPFPGAVTARAAVAKDTRVCVYDRAGLGASDPRPAGVAATGERYADELHTLLAGANVPGPYVLVGSSFAGLLVTAFEMRYPSDTAGLVYVDADVPCPGTCTIDQPEPSTFAVDGAAFGSRPVVVLVAEFGFVVDSRNYTRRSSNSMLVTALGSSHAIINDNPQLVVDATRLVIAAVRGVTPLPPCGGTSLPADNGRCESAG